MKISNNDIRKFLGLEPSSLEFYIDRVDRVDALNPGRGELMFINSDPEEFLHSYHCAYIIDNKYGPITSRYNDYIPSKNPKYTFAKLVSRFRLQSDLQLRHKSSYPKSHCSLPKKSIYCNEVHIGEGVQIDSTAIIGGTDFSPVIGDSREELIQFPQLGGVKIGNNVVVKYGTMIGKGTFIYTTIGDNTMIDYGCQIGHNCSIGNSCIIAAGTIIGGSTIIGDCTTIGIGAKIRNGLNIGSGVSIGMGAVVIHDIPDNCTVVGNPARVIEHKHIIDERGLK